MTRDEAIAAVKTSYGYLLTQIALTTNDQGLREIAEREFNNTREALERLELEA